ncbi:hypothetical protein HUJ05_000281 [Dendroctonus ponderosae]|nr:hypothetical protein HUJ05_000281 [Dendroctonus ponderosae]
MCRSESVEVCLSKRMSLLHVMLPKLLLCLIVVLTVQMYGMAKPLADSIGATVVKVGTTTTTTTTEMVCLYGFERTIGQKIAVLVLRAGFCIVDHRYFHSVVSRNNSPEQKKNPVFDLEDAANIQIKLKFDPKDVLAERGSSELLRAYESVAVHMPLSELCYLR